MGNDRRILVVIDDLDRLTPGEATEMVSLVKSLGDLPNVIYLLSFDHDNLVKLIHEGTKLDGREYLSKIIQYPVHLPPILGNRLSRVLDADIAELLGELTADWLVTLVDESPQLIADKDEEPKFLFSIDNKDRLRWLVINGLAKIPPDKTASLITSVIHSANDLTLITDVVRGIIGDSNPEGLKAERGRVAFGTETENVRDALLARVRIFAASGEIWKQARPEELLWFWWGANKEEVEAFTREAMNTSIGLIGLLTCSVSLVKSSAGDYERVSPTWTKIVDLEALRERALALVQAEDGDRAKQAERFLTALKRGQESSF